MTEPQKDWPAVKLGRNKGQQKPDWIRTGGFEWEETERYIPESALLSDEVVGAVAQAMAGEGNVYFRYKAKPLLEAAIKAASEQ